MWNALHDTGQHGAACIEAKWWLRATCNSSGLIVSSRATWRQPRCSAAPALSEKVRVSLSVSSQCQPRHMWRHFVHGLKRRTGKALSEASVPIASVGLDVKASARLNQTVPLVATADSSSGGRNAVAIFCPRKVNIVSLCSFQRTRKSSQNGTAGDVPHCTAPTVFVSLLSLDMARHGRGGARAPSVEE